MSSSFSLCGQIQISFLTAITTVGYGEITPRSFLGRLITLPLLVFGILLVALPSFVLGREFSSVWSKMSLKVGLRFRNWSDVLNPFPLLYRSLLEMTWFH
jgi:hypothetical protein